MCEPDHCDESGDAEFSLQNEFLFCENVVDQSNNFVDSGHLQKDLHECVKKLQILTREVSARSLFNDNESYEELPTSSIQYLLIPYYLAVVYQALRLGIEQRVDTLDKAEIYLKDFLRRLRNYDLIDFDLPWLSDDAEKVDDDGDQKKKKRIDPVKQREENIRNFQKQKELSEKVNSLKYEVLSHPDDDAIQRELLFTRLRLAALKAINDIHQIEIERPLAERMIKVRCGEASPPERSTKKSQMPFIIARDAAQKQIFGLGYPSVPTVTVDEWFDESVREGRIKMPTISSSKKAKTSDEENDVESSEEKEEEDRRKLQKWDEYKDTTNMIAEYRSNNDASSNDEGECESSDNDVPSSPNRKERRLCDSEQSGGPQRIGSKAGQMWSDFLLEQNLLETFSGNVDVTREENWMVNRDVESYTIPEGHPRERQTAPDPKRHRGMKHKKRRNNGTDQEGQDQMSTSGRSSRRTFTSRVANGPRNRHNNTRGHDAQNNKLKRLHRDSKKRTMDDYSVESLLNIDFPQGLGIDELAKCICIALEEKNPQFMIRVIKEIGEEKALELFNATREIEATGGMTVADGSRRRTPGGVFMVLFKTDVDIPLTIKELICNLQKANAREIRKAKRRLTRPNVKFSKECDSNRLAAEIFQSSSSAEALPTASEALLGGGVNASADDVVMESA